MKKIEILVIACFVAIVIVWMAYSIKHEKSAKEIVRELGV